MNGLLDKVIVQDIGPYRNKIDLIEANAGKFKASLAVKVQFKTLVIGLVKLRVPTAYDVTVEDDSSVLMQWWNTEKEKALYVDVMDKETRIQLVERVTPIGKPSSFTNEKLGLIVACIDKFVHSLLAN